MLPLNFSTTKTQLIATQCPTPAYLVHFLGAFVLAGITCTCQADDVMLNVDATVTAGTCNVLINTGGTDQTALGAPIATLTLDAVNTVDLSQGLEPKNLKPVTVQLTRCQGTRGGRQMLPRIRVTGTTVSEPHLFREASQFPGADARIGVVMATTAHPGSPGNDWLNYVSNGDSYALTETPTNYNGEGLIVSKNFWLGTSCGDITQCMGNAPASALASGTVNAKLTFDFFYQ